MNPLLGFPPVAHANAHILILGSMPGKASLEAGQYYAHPRNAFWRIMEFVFDIDHSLDYSTRCKKLAERGVAVWDVLESCVRQGSLDSSINKDSIKANDFNRFFGQHLEIKAIFFNGGMAEQSYKKHVVKKLSESHQKIPCVRLPSTSPAHAALSLEDKSSRWLSEIKKFL